MKSPSEMSDIELREAVAVEVMGWRLDDGDWLLDNPHSGTNGGIEMPCYELDIEAAFEVVEKMRVDGFLEFDLGTHERHWGATFKGFIGEVWRKFAGYGESPARAICIAALTAVRARKA